jgi:hypothetical protein
MSFSETQYRYTPPPPPPASAPARGGPNRTVIAVVVLAVLVGIGGAGLLARGGDPTAPLRGTPAPAVLDQARIDAIVRDAHSGRYFSNDHAESYPALFETGFVKGGLKTQPDMPDRAAACMLSYVETKWSFSALMKRMDEVKQIGTAAGLHCVKFA